ncbi:hypothetical protein [Streptomyces chrestomyceticus]|uniref:hypothetical protein n=1 Tax=Streptomyces chrestomyceticus TaxID=68185 RepID=UPI0035A8E155
MPDKRPRGYQRRKNIPLAQDILILDREWQRRYPAMHGLLACDRCALETPWPCEERGGGYVDGHIPATTDSSDFDAWSHVGPYGTHRAMVLKYPRSGMLQGAETYVRSVAGRPRCSGALVKRLRDVLEQWDRGLRAVEADLPALAAC